MWIKNWSIIYILKAMLWKNSLIKYKIVLKLVLYKQQINVNHLDIFLTKLRSVSAIYLTFRFRAPPSGGEKMNHFENASDLTHEVLYKNFNKIILLNILVKILIQRVVCQIWYIYKWLFCFSFKRKRLESKVLIADSVAYYSFYEAFNYYNIFYIYRQK